jgi:hypothetical protein
MESNQNENMMVIDGENEIGLMEWNREDEMLNDRFQTKQNTTQEIIDDNERNEMEENFQTFHVQRKIWKKHNTNAIYWAFYCVNDDQKIDCKNPTIMKCLVCYNSFMHALNPNTKKEKKTYNIL